MPTALITGITGQDGSFLAEQLLKSDWKVIGLMRRSASPNLWRLSSIMDLVGERLVLVEADLLDQGSLVDVLQSYQPDHIYNLAAQSFVPTSWRQPLYTANVTALGVLRMLEAVRMVCPSARFYQAGSSEMFGLSDLEKQNEQTRFHPRSPYGVSKVFGHNITVNYRESYGIFAVGGILFNHESERRGEEFVTRKIAMAVARIQMGDKMPLKLGNINVARDWGFAGDYTRAMHMMLSHNSPKDFVIATGKSWTVEQFLERAFGVIGLRWQDYVVHDPTLIRPVDIPVLCGDASVAKAELGWRPSLSFDELISRMVRAEIHRLER